MFKPPGKPIGVWFSIAGLILLVSGWLGYQATLALVGVRFRAQQRRMIAALDPAARARFNSTLSALTVVQMLRLSTTAPSHSSPNDLRAEAEKIQKLAHHPETNDLQPVLELNLGLTYAQLATLEERTNPAESRKYMDLAQDLFRSLGWRDCSEDALKDAGQKQYEIWNSKPKKAYP